MGGSDLFTGTLDLLILRATAQAPLHGYAIGKAIRDRTDGVLSVVEGALYPALHRLEGQGWLEADWGVTETGRRAKFYRITPKGAKHLEAEAVRWTQYSQAVAAMLGPRDH